MELYTHNIDETIRSNMQEFTDGECYIFERRVNSGVTGTGKHKHCHFNVQSLVDRIGGERISCWYLNRNENYEDGIYGWIWHSLWKTPEEKIVDVTYDGTGETTGIFWVDNKRTTNLEEGIGYNNIASITNGRARKIVKELTKRISGSEQTLVIGAVYWTYYLEHFMKLNEHSGEMRFIHGYENNKKLCEEKYEVKFNEDGKTFKCGETGKNLQKLKYDFIIMR